MNQPDPIDDEPERPPSKSARKREMHALQALGQRLTELSPARLDTMPLTDALRDALDTYSRIRKGAHEGRRRQMQLIGKLMRQVDKEAIEAALSSEHEQERAKLLVLQQATQWRDDLVSGERSWQAFSDQFPQAPDLSDLTAKAMQERRSGQPSKRQRELYRRLQRYLSEHSS